MTILYLKTLLNMIQYFIYMKLSMEINAHYLLISFLCTLHTFTFTNKTLLLYSSLSKHKVQNHMVVRLLKLPHAIPI